MKITRDRDNKKFSEINRALGNCFIVEDNKKNYYYEFEIKGNESLIKCDNLEYIEDVINEFRFYNAYITTFYNSDRSFYKSYDPLFTFKLPIKVIQPSQFFIDIDKLNVIEENIDSENIYIPVAIINDEYVALDGHTRLYSLYKNDYKMVNVYIDTYNQYINDFIYLAKENNIFNITNLKLLSHDDYVKYWDGFCDDYFNNL